MFLYFQMYMDIAIIPEEAHNGVGLYVLLLSVY